MADVQGNVDITVEGAGSLRDAAEAARSLADALRQAEESAGSISGAFGSAAEAAGKLRNDAEEAAKALKSIRDAGLGVGDVAATLGTSSEAAGKLRDDLAEAEDALSSLAATGPGAGDIAAFLEGDEAAAASLRTALQGVADAEAEVTAGGAGMGDGAAGLEAEAAAAGHARDNLIETAAAQDAVSSRAGSIEKTAADMRGAIAMMEQGQTALVSKIGPEQFGQVITKDAEQLEILGGGLKNVKTSMDDLGDTAEARLSKLNLVQDFQSAGQAMGDYEGKVAAAKDALAEAGPYIQSQSGYLDKAADAAGRTDEKLESLVGTSSDFKAAFADVQSATRDAASDLQKADAAAKDAGAGFDDSVHRVKQAMSGVGSEGGLGFLGGALSGWRNLLQGAGGDLEGLATDAGDAGEGVGGFGESISEAAAPITSKLSPMTAGIGALIGLVGGLGPAFGTAFAGGGVALGGFAALALPTLSKIESSYENVATARKTWTQAEQVAKADPTKTNLEEAATDAAKLKVAYQDVPATIRPVIQAFGNLRSQYDSMAKSFQPEVLKVTGDALSAASEGMSQFLKPAAELGGGLVDKGIKNLQTFMESPGAVKTFNDLLKETPGAVKSAGSAISSVGKFIGDAFGGVGVKGSESFIKSFDGLLKAIGPGTGTVVKGLAGSLKDIMNDASQAAPQIGKITGALGGLEKVNLSSLKSQLESIVNIGNKAGGGKAGSKGGLFGGFLGDLNQFEKDWDVTFPKSWDVGGKLGNAAKQAASQLIPGLGSSLKPQTLHLPVDVKPDVRMGHVDTSAMAKSLSGGSALPLPVKVEPKVDPGAMAKSLNLGGPKVPVPAEAKVDKADTSGLKGADAKVPATAKVDKVDTSGISKAAANVKIHGVTVDLADAKLSGLGALSTSLATAGASAGSSFDKGLASGISGGAGAATSAAQHVVTEIKSALSTLGGAGSAAGAALGAGLASGIAGSTGAAVAAATKMASEVTAAVAKAHETQSPSKVFKKIGSDDVKGLILGLEGGKSQLATAAKDAAKGITAPFTDKTITDTITKLQTDLKDALKAGTISPTEETGISAWLDSDNKRLMALAAQRKDIESKISSADALYKSVDQATVAGANVVTFAGNVTSGGTSGSSPDGSSSSGSTTSQPTAAYQQQQIAQAVSMAQVQSSTPAVTPKVPQSLIANDSIQGQLKQYLDQTRSFKNDIVKLKKEGLDSTSLQQLLQAGVTSGLPAAQMMLSGGSKGVQQIAQLQKQIAAQAKQLGVTGANAAYESGSQIDGGLAAGLKSELSSVTAAIKSLATSIVDEMEKDLKIKSPSQVAFGIGTQFAAGMAGGINSGGPMVGAAARELAIVASKGASGYGGGMTARPMPIVAGGGSGGGAGGGSQTMHFHLEVGGQEIAQVVQTYTLQHARRNTGSGLQLSGRGT